MLRAWTSPATLGLTDSTSCMPLVNVMDRWTSYLVEMKATPLLVWALDQEGDPVSCFDEGLLELPFKKVLELLLGMDMVEDEV